MPHPAPRPSKPPRAGLGPAGFNPLFVGVLLASVVAVIAGAKAGDHTLLGSGIVFHLVVGGITFAVLYGLVALLWLAWHKRLIQKVGVGPASGEAPTDQSTEEEWADTRDAEIETFMETTTKAIDELGREVADLKGDSGGDSG